MFESNRPIYGTFHLDTPPNPPPPPGGRGKTILLAVIVAVIVAVAVIFVVPLILGANPIDVVHIESAIPRPRFIVHLMEGE